MATFYDLIFNDKSNWDKELLITNVNRYSLHGLHDKVEEFMTLLQAEGDLKGKRVAALIPNLPVYFSLLVAVNKLGGTFIPLSHQFRSEDLTNILNLTNPHIVFTVKEHNGSSFKEMIGKWAEENVLNTTLFLYDGQELTKQVIPGSENSLSTENIDLIVCTSGSTGVPKGIKLNVNIVEKWTEIIEEELKLRETDRIFLTIPVTGAYGIYWMLSGLKKRFQMILPETFDIPIVMNLLKEFHCNKFVSTPSIFKGIYLFAKRITPSSLNCFEMGCLAGEQISSEFIELMREFENCRIINHYGLSEQGPLLFSNDIRSDVVKLSVRNEIQYQVIDKTPEGIGEILFKSPYRFDGYYLNEELTNEVLATDGWFYTGDLVRVNERNEFNFVGRKKQMIKKGGVQVIPGEIETVLNQHSSVLQAAVVGIPHSVYGEDIVAFVVLKEDIYKDELFPFLRNRIAEFKVPGKIIKINELPIIQGKLDKVTLGKLAIDS
jgi:acyl-coenzyme A synthetase/AMP-(fatty) acid ligase